MNARSPSGERTRPRVPAMTPSSSRTFSLKAPHKDCFGEAPKPAREGACAPQIRK